MSVTLCADPGPSVEDVVAVARGRTRVEVAPSVIDRLARARQVLDRVAAGGQAIYGFNTGLGAKSSAALQGDAAAFQEQFLRGRAIAMGEPLPTEIVRAAMLARAAGLAAGGSGLSPGVFEALVAALNAGVHAVMPRWGSVGAADLGLLAALGRMLIGEGEAEFGGRIMPAGEALSKAGLRPASLGPKDGLSLISANSVSIGEGALVVADTAVLLDRQNAVLALAMEGLGANLSILDPRLQAARPSPGQAEVAAALRALLEGSALGEPGADVPLQDPLSLRCAPSINGAAHHAVEAARAIVETELGSAADNPLVLADDAEVMSTGNFHAPALALAFETLGLALAQAANASAARFVQLTGAGRNGLPRNLSPRGGTSAGFVSLQKTAGALLAAIRHAAQPVILDVMPVSEGVEDQATQAPLAVSKCGEIVALYRRLVALELMAAAQAVDFRNGRRLGVGTAALQAEVRRLVDPLDEDRPLGQDAERLARHLADAALRS